MEGFKEIFKNWFLGYEPMYMDKKINNFLVLLLKYVVQMPVWPTPVLCLFCVIFLGRLYSFKPVK